MARKWIFAIAVAMGAVSALGLQAAPALAGTDGPTAGEAALAGVLGYEGGAYPGGFHPTSGSVEVEFTLPPLILLKQVGPTGHFRIPLGAGTYTVIGCGPSSGGGHPICGRPLNITLKAGEVDHVRLVWAMVP
jgi:hypothetical protein